MRIYLDTSAFVKRYSDEEGSDIVNKVFESHEIVTSHWTLAEAVAAIDKKVARRQITVDERDFSLSVLFSDVLGKVTFVKLSDEFLYPVIETVLSHHISADDALQLFSCMVSLSPVFLACDKNLIRAAKQVGLEAIDVEDGEDRRRLEGMLE
ncbi:MAG: PIN domain-containing protein [Methanobacteriota archaeon]|nr:MAG: PIN domain-containing protein [Euryarchaeota archaeon]